MKNMVLGSALLSVFLFLACTHTSAETLLLEDAGNPWWSPDGSMIACNRPTPSYSDEDIQIWEVPAVGGDPDTLILDSYGAFLPIWLPDGRHIVYMRATPGHEFVVYDLDGGPPVVWPVPSLWDDPGLSLSPDGAEILYTSSAREIWALNLSNGSIHFIREGTGGVISPDDQWLAFFTPDDTLAIEPTGGGPVQLFEQGAYATWTPDSQYLVFTGLGASGYPDLIGMSRDGLLRQQLTEDPEMEYRPAISPDGTTVAYGKERVSGSDLYLLDLGQISVVPTTWGYIKSKHR
jgi:dipeptidyl aminopeptidase/acylaminoacyl peptidase